MRSKTGGGSRAHSAEHRASAFAAVAVVATLLGAWGWLRPRTVPEAPLRRYELRLPRGQEIGGWFRRVAISPDGSRLAYLHLGAGGERKLMVLPRDELTATELPGTEGAEVPFFSPDGQRIGFISPRGTIKVVSATGGQVTPIATTMVDFVGATWSTDGFIYADGVEGLGLVRVPEGGGTVTPFTTLDTAAGETDHYWPFALPGGKGVLFVIRYGNSPRVMIGVADGASGRHRVVTEGAYAEYVRGHLVYAPSRNGLIVVQPFDERRMRLSGEPSVLAQGVTFGAVGAPDFVPDFTTSPNGTLVYATASGVRDTTEVVWVSRDGAETPVDPSWHDQLTPNGAFRLSPDGRRLAVTLRNQIWVRDLASRRMTQLSFDGGIRPEWTPDGEEVAYLSDRDSLRQSYIRRADAREPERPFVHDPRQVHEVVISRDRQWVVYRDGGGGTSDLIRVPLRGDTTRVPLVATPFSEAQAALSPNGRWLAYVSLETGREQVHVRPFPNTKDGNWLVSPAGGTSPVWAHSGRELFFIDGDDNLLSVPITPAPSFEFGAPRTLFSTRGYRVGVYRQEYSVAPDDRRFVFHRVLNTREHDRVIVIENVMRAAPAMAAR